MPSRTWQKRRQFVTAAADAARVSIACAESLEPRRLLSVSAWPVTRDAQINTFTSRVQAIQAMAMDANGDFVATWQSDRQDGSGYGVYARRFNVAGVPQGTEFRVNTYTTNRQYLPSIGMDSTGNFVIAWISDNQPGTVYAQRYDFSGATQGNEFRVNQSPTPGDGVTVAMSDSGFVIAWHSFFEVYAQRYDSVGVAQGSTFQVNVYTTDNQTSPSVAMKQDGAFVVTWRSRGQTSTNNDDLFGRLYAVNGSPLTGEFSINNYTTGTQDLPGVAMDSSGDFIVSWRSTYADPAFDGIFARRFDSSGAPLGDDFRVSSATTGSITPCVVVNNNEFVITFGGGMARIFDASGTPLGPDFKVSLLPILTPGTPTRAILDSAGDLVIGYPESAESYMRIFKLFETATAPTVGDRVWNDVNGNGIQDIGEAGVPGVVVSLYTDVGILATSATTDANGNFQLTVAPGFESRLVFSLPTGQIWALPDRGGDDAADSDIDPVTSQSELLPAMFSGTALTTLDAGLLGPAVISGRVFNDRDGNGIQGPGEELLPGFQVVADLDGDGLAEHVEPIADCANDGTYALLTYPGSYSVRAADSQFWTGAGPVMSIAPQSSQSGIDIGVRTTRPDSVIKPVGEEFQISQYTTGGQGSAVIASDANGDFVVVWAGAGQADSSGIYARLFDHNGAPLGSDFLVNANTNSSQITPAVAMDDAGDFVVAWASYGQDGADQAVRCRLFAASGTPTSDEFQANIFTTNRQGFPRVAIDDAGDFVVSWVSVGQQISQLYYGIYARRYNAAAVPLTGEIQVNSVPPAQFMFNGDVAMDDSGNFVVAWEGPGASSSLNRIYARRFDASGAPLGADFAVDNNPAGSNSQPSVALSPVDGSFVIAWAGQGDVYARRYDAAGHSRGGQFPLNIYTTGGQFQPVVIFDSHGDCIITWGSTGQDGSGYGVYARRFNAAGVPQGDEIGVPTYVSGSQSTPGATIDAAGNLTFVWSGAGKLDSSGAWAQRFGPPVERPVVISSSFDWQSGPQRIEIQFSQDVSGGLSVDELLLRNTTTTIKVASDKISLSWDAPSNKATLTFPALPNGGSLSDGWYDLTIFAAGANNSQGVSMMSDYSSEFFFLGGDANHDRIVDIADFRALSVNWLQTGRDFTQGDFNYDGAVDSIDLGILAAHWQMALPPTPPPAVAASVKKVPTRTAQAAGASIAAQLVDSTGGPTRSAKR